MTSDLAISGPWQTVDGPALVQAAAGLQLLPENIACLLRLQRLSAIGAALPPRPDAPKLSPTRLKKLLKDPLVSAPEVLSQEDPYDDLYSVDVPFFGGPHLVLQGLSGKSANTLSLFLRTLRDAGDNLDEGYIIESIVTSTAILRLSDALCKKASIKRGLEPPKSPGSSKIYVPDFLTLERLSQAVSFSHDELDVILPDPSLLSSLAQFSVQAGKHSLKFGIDTDDSLIVTPILTTESGIVIANPGELASSLRHHLITNSIATGNLEALSQAFKAQVINQVNILCASLGAKPAGDWTGERFERRRFDYADDKILDIAVAVDDLSNYNVGDPFGHWNTGDLNREIQIAIDPPGESTPEDSRTLRLVLIEGIGRQIFLGFEDLERPGPFLISSTDEIQTMADLDGGDPLFLWKFAKADSNLKDQVRVHSFSTLDNYAIYREANYSYYLSDDRLPTFMSIVNGSGTSLRIEAQRRHDRHEVASLGGVQFVEVVSLWGTDTAPIYFIHPRHKQRGFLIELESCNIWLTGDQIYHGKVGSLFEDFILATAYWTWQIAQHPLSKISMVKDSINQVHVKLSIDKPDKMDTYVKHGPPPTSSTSWVSASESSGAAILLQVSAGGTRFLFSEDNRADLLLIQAILDGFTRASGTPWEIESIINDIADSPRKRMLRTVDPSDVKQYKGSLPAPRVIQAADSSIALDELAAWLRDKSHPIGPIDDKERVTVLRGVVDHYFTALIERIARLSAKDTLETLITRHESLIQRSASLSGSLPEQIACFGESTPHVTDLAKTRNALTEALLVNRFLIEYTAAIPPDGPNSLTLSAFDELMAIGSELVTRATLSDAIFHGFSESRLSILPSGRLGVSRGDRFEAGTKALGQAMAESMRKMALSPTTDVPEAPNDTLATQIENAMLAEFGFTLNDIASATDEMIEISLTQGSNCTEIPLDDLESHLHASLDWSEEKVKSFVGHMTLRRRASFLSVGSDAWPWRYNREWSYLKRPLVLKENEDGSRTVRWGMRHLVDSANHWEGLVMSGRARGTTKELKSLMGSVRQGQNKYFELQVRDILQKAGCLPVQQGLTKVGGKKLISPSGADLGDIDAIGFHSQRRLIFVVEAKDFEMARNPTELANEADDLIRGDKSALNKLSRRSKWIEDNLAKTLNHFDMPLGDWTVIPIITTSRDLITPRVLTSIIPVIPFDQLQDWLRTEIKSTKKRRRRSAS